MPQANPSVSMRLTMNHLDSCVCVCWGAFIASEPASIQIEIEFTTSYYYFYFLSPAATSGCWSRLYPHSEVKSGWRICPLTTSPFYFPPWTVDHEIGAGPDLLVSSSSSQSLLPCYISLFLSCQDEQQQRPLMFQNLPCPYSLWADKQVRVASRISAMSEANSWTHLVKTSHLWPSGTTASPWWSGYPGAAGTSSKKAGSPRSAVGRANTRACESAGDWRRQQAASSQRVARRPRSSPSSRPWKGRTPAMGGAGSRAAGRAQRTSGTCVFTFVLVPGSVALGPNPSAQIIPFQLCIWWAWSLYLAVRLPRARDMCTGRRVAGTGYHSKIPRRLKKKWQRATWQKRTGRMKEAGAGWRLWDLTFIFHCWYGWLLWCCRLTFVLESTDRAFCVSKQLISIHFHLNEGFGIDAGYLQWC